MLFWTTMQCTANSHRLVVEKSPPSPTLHTNNNNSTQWEPNEKKYFPQRWFSYRCNSFRRTTTVEQIRSRSDIMKTLIKFWCSDVCLHIKQNSTNHQQAVSGTMVSFETELIPDGVLPDCTRQSQTINATGEVFALHVDEWGRSL